MLYKLLKSCVVLVILMFTSCSLITGILSQEYTISYNENGADSGTVPANQIKIRGESISLASNDGDLGLSGYNFSGWNTQSNGNGSSYSEGSLYSQDAKIVLYASWTVKPSYTVSFDSNTGSSVSKQSILEGGLITRPTDPTRDNCFFENWYLDKTLETLWSFKDDSVDKNMTLYAKWICGYTLTYDLNGASEGELSEDTEVYKTGDSITILDYVTKPVKNKFILNNWNTEPDGSGTEYKAGDTLTFEDKNIILYCNWESVYTLEYNLNGATAGEVPIDTKAYVSGDNAIILDYISEPIKNNYNNYIFKGWNTRDNGDGDDYKIGDTLTFESESVILYCKWEKAYSVTYNLNGATEGEVPIDTKSYVSGDNAIILDYILEPIKNNYNNYIFKGWNTRDNGDGDDYKIGDTLTFESESVILYCKWEKAYSITYYLNGATEGEAPIDTKAYVSGDSATILDYKAEPVKKNYILKGWNTRYNGDGDDYNVGDTLTFNEDNIYIYCKWQLTDRLTYDLNGATSGEVPIDTQTYEEGDIFTVSNYGSELTKNNSIFKCWNTEPDGSGTDYLLDEEATFGSSNATLYIRWSKVGTLGPSGGYIFYDDEDDGTDDFPDWDYLEAAPEDLDTLYSWGSAEDVTFPGLNNTGIGSGLQNTLDIISGYGSITTNAASACYTYSIDVNGVTYDDWFLPSSWELRYICTNLRKNGLGNFTSNYYWSSNYGEYQLADTILFENGDFLGYAYGYPWDDVNSVRPIRAF